VLHPAKIKELIRMIKILSNCKLLQKRCFAEVVSFFIIKMKAPHLNNQLNNQDCMLIHLKYMIQKTTLIMPRQPVKRFFSFFSPLSFFSISNGYVFPVSNNKKKSVASAITEILCSIIYSYQLPLDMHN